MLSDLTTAVGTTGGTTIGFVDEQEPVKPELTTLEMVGGYGKFELVGLERGWGTTLGNGLRRVLLGALPGTAITGARIDGVKHEFSTLPHMREGVSEFLINVRGIRIRSRSETTQRVLTLNVQGECEVLAGDIMGHSAYEIVNPKHHLATLDNADAKLQVRFDIERGEGYRAFNHDESSAIGRLPVDAIFTPVLKANYEVQNLSGRLSGHEGLTMEVWTDETVTPLEALRTAGNIFRERLALVTEMAGDDETPEVSLPPGMEHMEIRDLEHELSTRVINALVRHGISTLADLARYTPEYLKRDVRNFGEKSFNELHEFMVRHGIWPADGEVAAAANATESDD